MVLLIPFQTLETVLFIECRTDVIKLLIPFQTLDTTLFMPLRTEVTELLIPFQTLVTTDLIPLSTVVINDFIEFQIVLITVCIFLTILVITVFIPFHILLAALLILFQIPCRSPLSALKLPVTTSIIKRTAPKNIDLIPSHIPEKKLFSPSKIPHTLLNIVLKKLTAPLTIPLIIPLNAPHQLDTTLLAACVPDENTLHTEFHIPLKKSASLLKILHILFHKP